MGFIVLNSTTTTALAINLLYRHIHAAASEQGGAGADRCGVRGEQDHRHSLEHLRGRTRDHPLRGRTVRDPVQTRQLPLQGTSRLLQNANLPPQRRQGRTDLRRHARNWRQVGAHQETSQSHGENQVAPCRPQPRNPHERGRRHRLQEQLLGAQGQADDPPVRQGTLIIPITHASTSLPPSCPLSLLPPPSARLQPYNESYSLRSDSPSLSFCALDCEENMDLSSISHHSLSQSAVCPSLGMTSAGQEDSRASLLPSNAEEKLIPVHQMEAYMRVKDKYRKLSKIVEMFGNKLRKIQYQFLVKLENKCRDAFNFNAQHSTHYQQFAKSQLVEPNCPSVHAVFCSQMENFFKKKVEGLARSAFTSIVKRSIWMEKLECFVYSINAIVKLNKQKYFRLFFDSSKQKSIILKGNLPKQICFASKKIAIKVQRPLLACFEGEEKPSLKMPIVHPQRRESENIDICDNLNMLLLIDHPIFRNNSQESSSIYASTAKNHCESAFAAKKKPSDLTNISATTQQHEQCQKQLTLTELDQNFCYEVPLFELSQSAYFKEKPQDLLSPRPTNELHGQTERNEQVQLLASHYRLLEHQSELNRYISYRRSIEKQRDSTLQQIERSKETIKRIVYELQKSKNKQKIKLKPQGSSFTNQSNDKRSIPTDSKLASPTRTKTAAAKTPRPHSSKKYTQHSEYKISTTRDNLTSTESPIFEDIQEQQTASRNMEVYCNYVKAKKKAEESAHKKPPAKQPAEAGSARKNNTAKPVKAEKNLLVISLDPVLRERRIDVRVDLTKPQPNARIVIEKPKPTAKKSKK